MEDLANNKSLINYNLIIKYLNTHHIRIQINKLQHSLVPRSMIATEKNASEEITYNNVMEVLKVNESYIN